MKKHSTNQGSASLSAWLGLLACCFTVTAGEAPPEHALLLKISPTGRYLIDQRGQPFLVNGDTAWSLMAQATDQDVDTYLADRQKRGFNSIIVNLIEHKFSSHPPANRAGVAPFTTPGDFSTPNPEYFKAAHRIVKTANDHGIVVWLAPAYLGAGGGDEGFFREMKSSGREKLRAYGRFLARQFKDLPNLVWLLGGDYTPPAADRWTISELGLALEEEQDAHLITVHAAPENSAASLFGNDKWLTVNTVYTYQPTVFRPVLAEYARRPVRPLVLIETTYEGEHNAKPEQIRRQAYWALLGGACGQFLGNNPIWHYDGPGLFPVAVTWKEALDSTGSRDMARLHSFFAGIPWSQLVPEESHTVVLAGYGNETNTTLTAITANRTLSLTYVPSTGTEPREMTVDVAQFPAPVKARWFNPTSGQFSAAADAPLPNQGHHTFRTPGDNGTGTSDWVLVLTTR